MFDIQALKCVGSHLNVTSAPTCCCLRPAGLFCVVYVTLHECIHSMVCLEVCIHRFADGTNTNYQRSVNVNILPLA